MQNLTEDQRAQVKFIEELVRERDANRAVAGPAEAVPYVPAAFTCRLTSGPLGANLEGWITYATGPAVHFQSSEITVKEGLPIAMWGAHPVLALRPERIVNKLGTFVATGLGPAGNLQMKVDGLNVIALDAVLGGWGIGVWRIEGKVAFGA